MEQKIQPTIAFLLLVITFNADASVIYTYTGNPYNSFQSTESVVSLPYDNSMFVSGFFEMETALAPNLNGIDTGDGITLLDLSFSDGVATIDSGNVAAYFLSFRTNNDGDITDWSMSLYATPTVPIGDQYHEIFSSFGTGLLISNLDIGATIYCNELNASGTICRTDDYHRGISNVAGTWTISTVPVPAAVWLFGTALLGLVGFIRRRKAA